VADETRERQKLLLLLLLLLLFVLYFHGLEKKIETSWKTYKSLEEKTKRRRRRRLYEIVVVGASQSRVLLFFLKLLLASGSSRWCQTVKLPLITAKQQQKIESSWEKRILKKKAPRDFLVVLIRSV